MHAIQIRILETPEEMRWVEDLQAIVWPGDERTIVPGYLITAAVHHGGVAIGAFASQGPVDDPALPEAAASLESASSLVGFVFSFPGLYSTPDGPRLMHVSHMLAVHPGYRNAGIGFRLKRAQWQMVRNQGIDRILWTYDPLLSRNAYLNITRLGAVCSTYRENYYGEMRDGLNIGLPSDRFEVDWWVNTRRVQVRLSRTPRPSLDLAHFLAGEVNILLTSQLGPAGYPVPVINQEFLKPVSSSSPPALLLVEIPPDFQSLRGQDPTLALEWRLSTRECFKMLFQAGYLVTDFIHLKSAGADLPSSEGRPAVGERPAGADRLERSFYVLSYGESTL